MLKFAQSQDLCISFMVMHSLNLPELCSDKIVEISQDKGISKLHLPKKPYGRCWNVKSLIPSYYELSSQGTENSSILMIYIHLKRIGTLITISFTCKMRVLSPAGLGELERKGYMTPIMPRTWGCCREHQVWEEVSSSNMLISSLVSSASGSSKMRLLTLFNCLRTSLSYTPSSAKYQNMRSILP